MDIIYSNLIFKYPLIFYTRLIYLSLFSRYRYLITLLLSFSRIRLVLYKNNSYLNNFSYNTKRTLLFYTLYEDC